MKNKSRREFIIDGGKLSLLAIGSVSAGKGPLLPKPPETDRIQLPGSNCGKNNVDGNKILIAYASEFGSTAEVAIEISKVLCTLGISVETKWIKNVDNLNQYDAVILGSAIQYDKWMPEAREFVKTNKEILKTLPVAYFFTCLTLSQKSKKTNQTANEYAEKLIALAPQVNPLSIGQFAGVLDYGKMSLFQTLMFKTISLITGVQEGDYRDWDAIRHWATNTHLKILEKQQKTFEAV